MQYLVRWFDAASESVREEAAEADSPTQASQRYESAGHVVLSVQRQATRPAIASERLEVAWWCRELRTLLSAGMTIVEAIETLHGQSLGQARSRVHASLLDQLKQGKPLSSAMLSLGIFPEVLIAGVKASERTSALIPALDDFLVYHDMLDGLRKKVVSAAIYPAVVMGLGALVTLYLLLFVIPRFSRMYGELHGPVSLTTSVMVATSKVLAAHGFQIGLAVLALIVAIAMAWRSGAVARAASSVSEAVPFLRSRIDEFRLAKLYQSLALMFRGGYSLDDALGQCAALGLGGGLADAVRRAQAALARGQRVSSAFTDAGLTDAVTQRLLAVGERTGNFDRVLQTIAQRHAANFSTFVERATRIVEPMLLLVVALVVGGIVVAMYMPVFDIASSVR